MKIRCADLDLRHNQPGGCAHESNEPEDVLDAERDGRASAIGGVHARSICTRNQKRNHRCTGCLWGTSSFAAMGHRIWWGLLPPPNAISSPPGAQHPYRQRWPFLRRLAAPWSRGDHAQRAARVYLMLPCGHGALPTHDQAHPPTIRGYVHQW